MINIKQSKAMIDLIESTLDWLKEKEEYAEKLSQSYFAEMKENETNKSDETKRKAENKYLLQMIDEYDAEKKASQELQAFIIDNYRTLI